MSTFDDATASTMQTYQHIAPHYAEQHTLATMPPFWHQLLERFVTALHDSRMYQINPSLPVLDVGCGPGRDALLLAQHKLTVLAIDLSAAMLDEARTRCQNQPGAERITFRQMDMHALKLPENACAGLWASASFLHIPKHENTAVLKELLRVLVPGGPIMLIVKECDAGEPERYEVHPTSGTPRFFARYRGAELWELLEQAGVQLLEMRATPDTRSATASRWLAALGVKKG
jgi:ubiquinone/menaquinone biosynthesis C-methylase UbiE